MSTRLLLLMFDEVELLDFAGPYEVFTTANRTAARRDTSCWCPVASSMACSSDAEDLARRHPDLRVRPERRWVDNGRLADAALARRTARQLDVPWSEA